MILYLLDDVIAVVDFETDWPLVRFLTSATLDSDFQTLLHESVKTKPALAELGRHRSAPLAGFHDAGAMGPLKYRGKWRIANTSDY